MEVVVTEVSEPTYKVEFAATKTELLQLAAALNYVEQIMPQGNISPKIKGLATQIKNKVGARYFEWESK